MSVSVCAFCITNLDIILSAKLIGYSRKETNWGRGGWGWGGGKNILFWNPSGIFRLFYCISGNCIQSKAPPFKIIQLFVTSFGNFWLSQLWTFTENWCGRYFLCTIKEMKLIFCKNMDIWWDTDPFTNR